MSDLRKELRVPDEQHRELLTRVSVDEAIRSVRCKLILSWLSRSPLLPDK